MSIKAPRLQERGWTKRMDPQLPLWHQWQGHTNDCGPFSAAIATNALRGARVVEGALIAEAMVEQWPPERIPGWATFPWGVARMLRRFGLRPRWRIGASERRLLRNLDAGRTTLVLVGEPLRFEGRRWAGWSHYKLLYAWGPEAGWAFVDPGASGSRVYTYQKAATFRRLWTWMGRQCIEVED